MWLLLPLMHSEALADQEQCYRMFGEQRDEAAAKGYTELEAAWDNGAKYAAAHRDVVAK